MNPLTPMNETMLQAALTLFSKVSVILSAFVGLIFVMRICFLSIRIANVYEYVEVIGDTVKYFGITYLYPIIVKLIVLATGGLALSISYAPMTAAQSSIEEFMRKLFSEIVLFQVFGKVGDILMNLFTQSIYTVFISLLLAIAPVMIFFSTMLGISQGIGAYFSSLLSLCMWPVLWNLLGLLGRELWPNLSSSPVSSVVFWLVIQVLQLFSPLFCVLLFRTLSPSQAISKVISIVG
ncbi:MAG: hypothetical protein JSU04_20260 [Bdellovibrionales bacterium]|nr:hypothetical protein [Bdellovibrionales bacterium]